MELHGYIAQPEFLLRHRRLFLRGYRPPHIPANVRIDVQIFVELRVSDSGRDALEDVVDYNVMRDTLLALRPGMTEAGCMEVAEALSRVQGVSAAIVTMSNSGNHVCEAASVRPDVRAYVGSRTT